MNQQIRNEDRGIRSRRGAVALIVMLVILMITLISGSILQVTLMHRRQIRREVESRQAAWLAEAAVSRAAARRAAANDYAGEVWEISAEQLGSSYAATVEIRVAPNGQGTVTADYPNDDVRRNRVTRLVPATAADSVTTEASTENADGSSPP